MARLAVSAADRLTVEDCGGEEALAGLQARAWAHLGNAFRTTSISRAPRQAFAVAETLLNESRVTLFEKARCSPSWPPGARRSSGSARPSRSFDRVAAIYKKLGQWNLLGRTLLQKATVCGEAGDGEGEMTLLRRALDLIDPQADPRVFLAARHNLIHALVRERPGARGVRPAVPHAAALPEGRRPHEPAEAPLAQGGGGLRPAAYRAGRGGVPRGPRSFLELGLDYDAALASSISPACTSCRGAPPT